MANHPSDNPDTCCPACNGNGELNFDDVPRVRKALADAEARGAEVAQKALAAADGLVVWVAHVGGIPRFVHLDEAHAEAWVTESAWTNAVVVPYVPATLMRPNS